MCHHDGMQGEGRANLCTDNKKGKSDIDPNGSNIETKLTVKKQSAAVRLCGSKSVRKQYVAQYVINFHIASTRHEENCQSRFTQYTN
jgi:hypothetical protein